jgi:hypothetical protein
VTTPGNQPTNEDLLDRVRKLLAKAEDDGCTPAEAEALTAKAAELMARYGIDRALLGTLHPGSDKPADRVFDLDNPWAAVKAHLLSGLAAALRCQCVLLNRRDPGSRVHVFGYQSDLDRVDMLFTSLLVQMHRALAQQVVPGAYGEAKAWRRSYMLGYASAVVSRIRAAEEAAVTKATAGEQQGQPGAALVLADRALVVKTRLQQAYPRTRQTWTTYTGSGYRDGHAAGQRADIGGARVGGGSGRALTR